MKIDMHTHAFADAIVERAMAALKANIPPDFHTPYDGRLPSLVRELKSHGFDHAVLCQIATKPSQFAPILEWSRAIRDGRLGEDAARMILPLPSVHPADPDLEAHVREIAREGFKGIKLHPYYQGFVLDDPVPLDLFRMARDNGLFVEIHAGFDIGFPFEDVCGPRRTMRVVESVPGLRLMISHFGGWRAWEEADEVLVGTPVDLEISMSVGWCDPALLRSMLLRHPADRLYFGSDWPWSEYDKTLPFLGSLGLPAERLAALMGGNAARFLGLS